MNVLVLNEQKEQLQSIDVDIIKSVTGLFDANEVVKMFKDFFYNKMIIDVTALKSYNVPSTYKIIANGLNPDKVIFYLPEGSDLCTSGFLSNLISFGLYNFTTNVVGVKFLINKSNTFKDVENIVKLSNGGRPTGVSSENKSQKHDNGNFDSKGHNYTPDATQNLSSISNIEGRQIILGIKNVTQNAGATSLIYMMKNELSTIYNNKVVAIEIDKKDFLSYGDKLMLSSTSNEVGGLIKSLDSAKVILVDLNNCRKEDLCTEIIYLIEPSVIKLNTLIRVNKVIISSLKNKKVILNKSLLTPKEVSEFEYESGIKILYNMPPLNDRKRNSVITDFLKKINLISNSSFSFSGGKIFGLFRK